MRPISNTDLYMIANYLKDTDKDLFIAISELGFNPNWYSEDELQQWLKEINIILINNIWRNIND